MKDYEIISQGIKPTGVKSFLGIIFIIFGGISFIATTAVIPFVILLSGLLLSFSPYMIKLDYKNRRYKIYQVINIFSGIVSWKSFSDFGNIHVTRSMSSGKLQSIYRNSTYNMSSFDIVIITTDGKKLLIGEFDNHGSALIRAKELAESLDLNYIDEIEEARKNSIKKRNNGNIKYSYGKRRR